ncbi:TPA: restriction endonuclease subunit S [Bacillus cereus]
MNVPKLRFKEFDGEFNKYNIERLVTVTDCKHDTAPIETKKTIYKMIRTGNVRNGNLLVKTMDSVSEDTFHKWSLRGYLEPNDIILTREAPMGEVAIIPKNSRYKFFLGQRCLQLKANAELSDSVYIYFLLQGERFQKYIRPLKFSGSTVSNIRIPELKSFEFEIPSIKEQIKIGDFLSKINKKIQLQQQKIDLLQEQKKGFLQKMFPKAGETQPEMRFEGFTGDWEERKLKDIVKWSKGSNLPKSVLNESKEGDEVIHYADLYKFSPVVSYVIHWSDSGQGTVIPDNSLLFPMSDVTPVGLARTSTITKSGVKAGSDTLIGMIDEKNNSQFISYQINANSQKIIPLVTGTTVRHISAKALDTLDIMVTSQEEQVKISTFFKQLDDTIALHQQKLDLYKEQKKGFMQQLFI